jgi:DNA-binding CsgD family transcriptional regulator
VAHAVQSLDAFGFACVVVDALARVVALSRAAEGGLASGDLFLLAHGRIRARSERTNSLLQQAIARCTTGGSGSTGRAAVSLLVLNRAGEIAGRMFVATLPDRPFGRARAMIAFRPRHCAPVDQLLIEGAGLTAKEAAVAVMLSRGFSVAEIAEQGGISHETVRSRIKSVYAKLGVSKQSELSNLIGRVG